MAGKLWEHHLEMKRYREIRFINQLGTLLIRF